MSGRLLLIPLLLPEDGHLKQLDWRAETVNKKRNYLFIACITIGIAMLLWLESNKNFTYPEGKSESPSLETIIASSEEDYSIQIPDSWQEEIDSYNRIDATVTVPESISTKGFKSASAEKIEVDQEGVLSVLEDYYHPQKGIENEQKIQYLGEDDMYLYFDKSTGKVSLTSTFRDYVFMAYREEMTEYYNRDLYPVDQDLDHFTVSECDEKLLNFCEKIGIEGDIQVIHRSLDYKTMEAEAVELHQDGTETKPDYQWTSDDNSYYCTFSQTCNDIPIIPIDYLQYYSDILNESAHTCLLNKERLVSIHIDEIYDIRYHENYEKLMEFNDILEKYRQYVSISKQNYETVVTDITMRAFAASQGDENYQVTPVWIFYGYWKSNAEDITGAHAVFINAVTGERL